MIHNLMAVALLGGLVLVSFATGAEFGDPIRRAVRSAARKLAPQHPGTRQARTALVAEPEAEGEPVLGEQMVSEVREQWNAWHDETDSQDPVRHANKMHAASEPYMPPPPVRADLPVIPVRTADRAPWTGEFPAVVDDVIERERVAYARVALEALGDDPTESGVGRVMLSLRALPSSSPAAHPCCECCGFCGGRHAEPCEGGCNDAPVYGQAPVADVTEAGRLAEGLIS